MKLPTPSARWITLRQWRRQPTNFLISVGTRGGRRQARNGLQGVVGEGGRGGGGLGRSTSDLLVDWRSS